MLDRPISRRMRIVLGSVLLAGLTFRLWAEWDTRTHWAPLPRLPMVEPIPAAHLRLTSEGARKGLELAELHIRHRVGFTLTAGLPGPPGNNVSMLTGLPLYRYANCVIEKEESDFADAYQSHIQEYFALGGSFENSVHPWLADFEDLAAFWDKLAADRAPQAVTQESPAITSPDGRSTLRVVKRRSPSDASESLQVLLSTKDGLPDVNDAAVCRTPTSRPATIRIAWGPKGSAFALVRSEINAPDQAARESVLVVAVDLRTGQVLKFHHYAVADGKLILRKPRDPFAD